MELGGGVGGLLAIGVFQAEAAQGLEAAGDEVVAGQGAGLPGVAEVGAFGRLVDRDAGAAGGKEGEGQEQAFFRPIRAVGRRRGAMGWSLSVPRGSRTDRGGI